MLYVKLSLDISDVYHETLILELMEMDFDGFEQLENQLIAYIPQPRFHDVSREQLEQMVQLFPEISSWELSEVPEENWNAAWEQTLEPQVIGPFLVKPTWADYPYDSSQILIEIDPKMSFGTGYHATTRLVLEELPQLNLHGKRILDAGTGTGILAIAAVKLGAASAVGFDIDPWCERNALENRAINGVEERVNICLGGIETIPPDSDFDLMLANINRNVILSLLEEFVSRIRQGGVIVVTGILITDRDTVVERAETCGLKLISERDKEEWTLLRFQRT
ncbi:MAG: 50S ribosomal protein L11 methyltransferase [Balneolaceae bacterium]